MNFEKYQSFWIFAASFVSKDLSEEILKTYLFVFP